MPAGFLVAGTNPRLAFNDDYRGFFGLAAGQIANAISNVRAYEEERKRAEALAEIDRAKTMFFSRDSRLIYVILISAVLGAVAVALIRRWRRRH